VPFRPPTRLFRLDLSFHRLSDLAQLGVHGGGGDDRFCTSFGHLRTAVDHVGSVSEWDVYLVEWFGRLGDWEGFTG
jgi:hypothetical protein